MELGAGVPIPLPDGQEEESRVAVDPPESEGDRMVRIARCLMERGVSGSQVKRLLASYDLDRIERQIAWLDARRAKRKSSLLIAAIDQDYEEPHRLKVLREIGERGPDEVE